MCMYSIVLVLYGVLERLYYEYKYLSQHSEL